MIVLLAVVALVAGCSADVEPPDATLPEVADEEPRGADGAETADNPGAADDGLDGGHEPTADSSAPSGISPGVGGGLAPPFEPPAPPEGRERLAATAESLLAGALETAGDGQLSVLVTDEYGREILSHGADEPLLPASTVKIVTAAAVLSTLGPEGRLETRVETTAPIDGDGTVRGDLVLIGGGDPVLATQRYGRWVYPLRPRTPLESLADALVEAGVRHVEGELVGTSSGYTGPAAAAGWPDRYFRDFDARYHAGLTVDAGLRTLVSYPEAVDTDADDPTGTDDAAAAPASEQQPPSDGTAASGLAAVADGDGTTTADEEPGPPRVRVDHAADPTAHAAAELVRLLAERDVEVVGGGRSRDDVPVTIGRLAVVHSPPMDELLRFAVQRSDNHITDALFRAVGGVRTGQGSWDAGDRALRQVLERYGIDHERAMFADGSGLSRDDRATARLLVEVDRAMRSSRHRATWDSLMAVMGESGTLDGRLRATPAQGRFLGKTGTLQDVMGLVGTVLGDAGQARYHVAVVANASGEARWTARTLADELVLLLSADVEGCRVAFGDADPGPLGLPPLAAAC